MHESSLVRVTTSTFADLLEASPWPLAMDSYQRGFVWGPDKLVQLVDDLTAYTQQANDDFPYYMGAVLIHRDAQKNIRFIIDGQQRLTALSLLYFHTTGAFPSGQAFSYSGQSALCIRQALQALEAHPAIKTQLIERLCLTVIEVDSADLAFTFFDTQNNRGVRLEATDLFKAYHLRAIDHAAGDARTKSSLQQYCASRWEALQRQPPILSPGQDFAPNLFSRFLWRARRWRGSKAPYGRHDALVEEFQQKAWTAQTDARNRVDSVPLYPTRHNRLATALTLDVNGERVLQGGSVRVSDLPANLPMALRQPIHEGLGFFLYADKYGALLQGLMNEPASGIEVTTFRGIYRALLQSNQEYLREIFLLCCLVYVDQFGADELIEFSLRLEYLLGALRLDKKQVRQETASNFFKKSDMNLLDVIAHSYHPRQVLDFLQDQQRLVSSSYVTESVETGQGVQGRYKRAVLNFYRAHAASDSTTLAGKSQWLEAFLGAGKGAHYDY